LTPPLLRRSSPRLLPSRTRSRSSPSAPLSSSDTWAVASGECRWGPPWSPDGDEANTDHERREVGGLMPKPSVPTTRPARSPAPPGRVAETARDLRERSGAYHRYLLREMLVTGGE